jgi:hypothetical protein
MNSKTESLKIKVQLQMDQANAANTNMKWQRIPIDWQADVRFKVLLRIRNSHTGIGPILHQRTVANAEPRDSRIPRLRQLFSTHESISVE